MSAKAFQKTALEISKWIFIILFIGIFTGCASSLFLASLNWVTNYREQNIWIISLLPLAGLLIGLMYFYWGKNVVKGNNLILEEYENPEKTIPLKMAPLVLITTLITHLFGGSAGREGTAVQMGGAIADQFTSIFNLNKEERKIILILGISAGFASVFGTPFTAAIFSIEILYFSNFSYKNLLPSFLVAFVAYYTVEFWQIKHTHYHIPEIPDMSFSNLFWIIIIGILFGLTAMLFARLTHFWNHLFSKNIKFPPLRPFFAGIVIAIAVFSMGSTQFIGLGIPTIITSFEHPQAFHIFLLKILFTSFTLGSGFKGGEVTPLFFVGATLGSALSIFVPLPVALLAGIGFVAVFSGATHTPIACTIMGMELFGIECGIYVGLTCTVAYFCSGPVGIYQSQIVKGPKKALYRKFKREEIGNL
ncbi:MAG: chloride channel protein [Flavobacterium sp.]